LIEYINALKFRNLSVLDGLCNGTRVQIIEIIGNNLLKCRYINGPRANAANGADEFLLHKHPFEHGGGTNGTGGEQLSSGNDFSSRFDQDSS
jgi:hypothetical protein